MNYQPEAQTYIDGIQSDIERIEDILYRHHGESSAMLIEETRRRYLPDTLEQYNNIPSLKQKFSLGNAKTNEEILVEQLKKLAFGVRQAVESIIHEEERLFLANGRFLSEKFENTNVNTPYQIVKKQPVENVDTKLSTEEPAVWVEFDAKDMPFWLPIVALCVVLSGSFIALVVGEHALKDDMQRSNVSATVYESTINKTVHHIEDFKRIHKHYPNIKEVGNLPDGLLYQKDHEKAVVFTTKNFSNIDLEDMHTVDGKSCKDVQCYNIIVKIPGGMFGTDISYEK